MRDKAVTLFPGLRELQDQWIREQDDAEVYQAIHRVRQVRNEGRFVILIGQRWPELLEEPDVIEKRRRHRKAGGGTTSENFEEALRRALAIYDIIGFFNKEIAAWVGIGARDQEEKIRQLFAQGKDILKEIENSGRFPTPALLIKDIYNSKAEVVILYTNDHFWKSLLAETRKARPTAEHLECKLEHFGRRRAWIHGVGSVFAARRFYEKMGVPEGFQKQDWKPTIAEIVCRGEIRNQVL